MRKNKGGGGGQGTLITGPDYASSTFKLFSSFKIWDLKIDQVGKVKMLWLILIRTILRNICRT